MKIIKKINDLENVDLLQYLRNKEKEKEEKKTKKKKKMKITNRLLMKL